MYTFEFYDRKLHIPHDPELFLIKPTITMGANLSWTMTAQISSDHPYFTELSILKYGVKIRKNGKLLFRGRLTECKQGFNKLYNLYAEDKLAALNDSPCRPNEFAGAPEDLFAWFLDNHNAQVGEEQKLLKGRVTVTDPNDYITRSWEKTDTTWNLMNSRLLDTLGGYFVVRYEEDGDYLDWLEGFELYSTQDIVFGENLLDFEKIIDATETYTACIPYGAEIETGENAVDAKKERVTIESVNDGRDYLINEDMAGLYGIIYAPVDLVTWDDVTRPENLLSKATDWLNNDGVMMRESVTLSATDLSAAGVDVGSFEMYQNVRAIIEPLDLRTSYLITGMKVNAAASEIMQITVGNERKTLSAQMNTVSKNANSIIQRVENIESDYVLNEQIAALEPVYMHIRYAPVASPSAEQMTEEPAEDTEYIGVCHTKTKEAPTDPAAYGWAKFKGDQGDPGDKGETGTGIESITPQYYVSSSAAEPADGEWVYERPSWQAGKYLWNRSEITYKNPASVEYTTAVCENEWMNDYVTEELATASSQILQTAEEVTVGILAGYVTASALEEYRQEVENTLTASAEGFSFEFSQLEQRLMDMGAEVVEKNQFIRLQEGNIIIGKSDSPILAVFTNDALEFRFNDQVVARFTNEVLEVRNIAVENQMRFGSNWAIRPGEYIESAGYNLNDVWIGG